MLKRHFIKSNSHLLKKKNLLKKKKVGNSLEVQWLWLSFACHDLGSIPGWGTKVLRAESYNQKTNFKKYHKVKWRLKRNYSHILKAITQNLAASINTHWKHCNYGDLLGSGVKEIQLGYNWHKIEMEKRTIISHQWYNCIPRKPERFKLKSYQ